MKGVISPDFALEWCRLASTPGVGELPQGVYTLAQLSPGLTAADFWVWALLDRATAWGPCSLATSPCRGDQCRGAGRAGAGHDRAVFRRSGSGPGFRLSPTTNQSPHVQARKADAQTRLARNPPLPRVGLISRFGLVWGSWQRSHCCRPRPFAPNSCSTTIRPAP